jgi:polyisoprenoid-binding protein YceI
MPLKRKVGIVVGVVVLSFAIAGAAAYWFVLRSTAAPPAALPTRALVGSSATLNGTWRIQPGPGVFVGYRIHELFGGDALSRAVTGRTPAVSGQMTIGGSKVTAATVTGDMSQLTSDEGRRDRYIKTHGLDTATMPTATFRLTAAIDLSHPAVGQVVRVLAHGALTLHGVTKPVAVPLQARWNGATVDVSGNLPISLGDYGIDPPNIAGLVKVDSNGQFELQLTFDKS